MHALSLSLPSPTYSHRRRSRLRVQLSTEYRLQVFCYFGDCAVIIYIYIKPYQRMVFHRLIGIPIDCSGTHMLGSMLVSKRENLKKSHIIWIMALWLEWVEWWHIKWNTKTIFMTQLNYNVNVLWIIFFIHFNCSNEIALVDSLDVIPPSKPYTMIPKG